MGVSRANALGVTEGLLWVIGNSDEENALLDPLPDGVEAVSEKPDHDLVKAAVVVLDDDETIAADLDDALPQVGSIRLVWTAFRATPRELTLESVSQSLADYGWSVLEQVDLGAGWTALRVEAD